MFLVALFAVIIAAVVYPSSLPVKCLVPGRPFELDVDKMLKKSTFKIKPHALIERAKRVLQNKINCTQDLADNFEMIFPVIGPIKRTEFLEFVKYFDIPTIFNGSADGLYYNFNCDPYEPNRVWFYSRFIGKHAQDSEYFGAITDRIISLPTQICSLSFDGEGKVTKFTGGYVCDRTQGNSGGLGGVFGLRYALNRPLPFREARPYKPSMMMHLYNFIGKKMQEQQRINKNLDKEESIVACLDLFHMSY